MDSSSRRAVKMIVAISLAAVPCAAESSLENLGWLGDLSGWCWKGSDEQGKITDRQCYSTQFGRFLRGSIEVHAGSATGKAHYFGDSMFAWDAKRSRITYFYWASAGHFGSAESYYEGEKLVFPPTDEGDPAQTKFRSIWTRLDSDTFEVVREKWVEGAWQRQTTAVYRRDGAVEKATGAEPVARVPEKSD